MTRPTPGRQLCDCGDWETDHTFLVNQTYCNRPRCDCREFEPRTDPPLRKPCDRCHGEGRWSEVDPSDGGSLFIVCPDCGGAGATKANGESLLRTVDLSW